MCVCVCVCVIILSVRLPLQDVLQELSSYGHELEARTSYMAVVQGVSRDPATGEISAFSDPRKHAEARLLYEDEL